MAGPSRGDIIYVPSFDKHGVVTSVSGSVVRIKFNPGRGAPHRVALSELYQAEDEVEADTPVTALIPVQDYSHPIPEPPGSLIEFRKRYLPKKIGLEVRLEPYGAVVVRFVVQFH